MKKTTYAIIALSVVAILSIVIYVPVRDEHTRPLSVGELRPYPIGHTDGIDEIDFSMPNDDSILARIFSGVEVEISDTLSQPVLVVDTLYRQFVDVDIEGSRMMLSMKLGAPMQINIREIYVASTSSLKIMLPPWPLRKISSTHAKMSITGLDTDRLQLFCNDNLYLTDCRIDSAFFTLGGYAKCRFKESEINFMRLNMEDNFLKIDCCDSSAVIHKLDFKPLRNVKTDVYLNPANIDTLVWNRNDSAQLTLRMKHPIIIQK